MACKILNVVEPKLPPEVVDVTYGFAEVAFVNRMFDTPCEENEIIGLQEAIGLVFTVKNADTHPYADIRFTVNYLRPGETVKRSWTANLTLASGTYERFIYNTDLKYKQGQYSGLTLGIDILK